ncbi:probable calcium-binding protein CML46 [Cornus florida]|uniref:probable calcium-binding protein CML46 n=1 Tax=Cornus florida TaxID=4283 RepID=UPI00289E97A0|nr:probable calcium-binding protein CML46 [Cornus florida]
MCSYNLNHFPVENISLNPIQLAVLIFGMIDFFLFHIVFNKNERIFEFFSRSRSFIQSQLVGSFDDLKVQAEEKNQELEVSNQPSSEDGNLCRVDVETVMQRLGLVCHPEGEKIEEGLSSDNLFDLFEEKEPSLEEVKEAFDVFDENRDGFVDARELQRVLCVLGFKDGLEMENCRKMIGVFDENGDGRIDFNEFVKFMENSFC